MTIDVALAPRDSSSLKKFLASRYTAGSPEYHDFLKPGQFGPRFGANQSTISSLESSLARAGITRATVSTNGLLLRLSASAGAIERAFHTSLERYRLRSGRVALANQDVPLLPSALARAVTGVVGLSTLNRPKPMAVAGSPVSRQGSVQSGQGSGDTTGLPRSTASGPSACTAASGLTSASGPYTANELAQAYGFQSGAYANGRLGAGETIALYELEPYLASDISTFEQCFGIDTSVTNVPVDGGPGSTGAGSGEAALDIEETAALAPRAQILVYEGPDSGVGPLDTYNAIAGQDRAEVVSTSWGSCESAAGKSSANAENSIFEEMAAQGQTILAAAGDSGSEDCYGGPGTEALVGAACWATSSCVAVGTSRSTGEGVVLPLPGSGSGTGSGSGKPAQVASTGALLGVACPPADPSCLAVGQSSSGTEGAVVALNAGVVGSVTDVSQAAVLADVTCASTTVCVAVGQSSNGTEGEVVTLTDGSVTSTAQVAAASTLDAVSCASTTICTAVGQSSSGTEGVVVAIDAGLPATVEPVQGTGVLGSVACPTSSYCVAVGSTSATASSSGDGVLVPISGGAPGAVTEVAASTVLEGVECTSEAGCLAVGGSGCAPLGASCSTGAGNSGIVVPVTDGKVGSPVYGSNMGFFEDIACSSASSCLGVGESSGPGVPAYALMDNGSPSPGVDVPFADDALAVDDPSAQPYVTAVGGTYLSSITNAPSESVWNGDYGAGGGGISSFWTMPSWQEAKGVIADSSGTPCGAPSGSYCREVPDVAADASPSTGVVIYYDGQWVVYGGTSMAAPIWASLAALADQACAAPAGLLTPALYAHPGDLNEVTQGSNDYLGVNKGDYEASQVYNLAGGLGTPTAALLAPGVLCPASAPAPVSASASSVSASPGTAGVGQRIDVTVHLVSSGGAPQPEQMVCLVPGSGSSATITPTAATGSSSPCGSPDGEAITGSGGNARFTVADTVAQSVTLTATDLTGNVTLDESVTVGFVSLVGYHALTPYRICDTRAGNPSGLAGGNTQCAGSDGSSSPIGAGQVKAVKVGGTQVCTDSNCPSGTSDAVPASGASAVILNLTVTDPTAAGYLTVYPAGEQRPGVSNLNFTKGETAANMVTVALPASGSLDVFSYGATSQIVVDVEGWFGGSSAGEGLYDPLSPGRICDTRPGNPSGLSGTALSQCEGKAPLSGQTLTIQVAGLGGVPASGAGAVMLNITAVGASAGGYLAAWPAGQQRPESSVLNYVAGSVVPGGVIVPLGTDGEVSITTSGGNPDLVVDVGGYFTGSGNPGAGGAVLNVEPDPVRICDTRPGNATACSGEPLQAGASQTRLLAGQAGIPTSAVVAAVVNVTVTEGASSGYLTIWPASSTRPTASDLNWSSGLTRANLVTAMLQSSGSGSGSISLYDGSQGSVDYVLDVFGWYTTAP